MTNDPRRALCGRVHRPRRRALARHDGNVRQPSLPQRRRNRAAAADPIVADAPRRLVDAMPNGPRHHPPVQVFLAGGVPEVMLHLRRAGLLETRVFTVSGTTPDAQLDAWEVSARRAERRRL